MAESTSCIDRRVFAVAEHILQRTGEISSMKLHRLVYYCQGWHLAWDGQPLFLAEVQAWASGPVVPQLHAAHRGTFLVGPGFFDAALEDPEARARIDAQASAEHARRTHGPAPKANDTGAARPNQEEADTCR